MSIDVDRASYSNIRRFLNQGSMPPKDAVRVEEMINYFHYDYKSPSNNENIPFKMYTTYADCPWNQDHKLLHVAMKAKELDRKNLAASNMVFLIDISGSMQSSNKLPLVRGVVQTPDQSAQRKRCSLRSDLCRARKGRR
jgi:Ca-activated chloride channel family protein